MKFLKKNWFNLIFILLIILLFIPQTRKPIQVALNRLVAVSPSEVPENKRQILSTYEWRFKDMEGGIHSFEESRGEVAVVNFWATWCPPCIAEMPSFEKLYRDYGDEVNFYFVSSEGSSELREFMKRKELQLPIHQPLSATPEQLRSNSLPTTYVIATDGTIVVEKKGAANWNDQNFRELLDQLLLE